MRKPAQKESPPDKPSDGREKNPIRGIGPPPEILAPAGGKASFLAALAARADAVYCGLKSFSARMAAENFDLRSLARYTALAHERKTKVYVALNTLLRPSEVSKMARTLEGLQHGVHPDAVIIQDLGLIPLIRRVGLEAEIHLSTLANVGVASSLAMAAGKLGCQRVVIPRELGIEEMKIMAAACPRKMGLEVFVHGALCYAVSGKCYWSSYLGGRSGLRGRCVQPCRRLYSLGGDKRRLFSCRDLSLDVLVKVLLPLAPIRAWKIEGRKKGPHYVYHTAVAYRMLRDAHADKTLRSAALAHLSRAMGRPGTHYRFLPQRPWNPLENDGQTASGLMVGRVRTAGGRPYFIAREPLLAGDLLRIGYEDQSGHAMLRISKGLPRKGRWHLKAYGGAERIRNGAPVFLVDRREPSLIEKTAALKAALPATPPLESARQEVGLPPLKPSIAATPAREVRVYRHPGRRQRRSVEGLWLSARNIPTLPAAVAAATWYWLPPVIWPDEEARWREAIAKVREMGGRLFVLNAPWQKGLFLKRSGLTLWAGPFCNLANGYAVQVMGSLGFAGAIVSPELTVADYSRLAATSPLPLGIVLTGSWPLCVSRIAPPGLESATVFNSPRNERAWIREIDGNHWLFPNWRLDLSAQRPMLEKMGFTLFVHLEEPVPEGMHMKRRPGLWNWRLELQ
jgi:putative protease